MNTELYHYGVKGMKWGVRRYQNPDGTLTPAGKKRYDKMSDDKLQKTLYKQVKDAREAKATEKYGKLGPIMRWAARNDTNELIGEHTKSATTKFDKAANAYKQTEEYKQFYKDAEKLDNKWDRILRDEPERYSEYAREWEEKITKKYERTRVAEFTNYSDITNKGKRYTEAYLNKYGKDLNIAYLRDLGYDESTAKEFAERIMNSKNKMLNGE